MFEIAKTSYSYDNDVLVKFNIKQNFRNKTIVIETFIKFVQLFFAIKMKWVFWLLLFSNIYK